MGENSPVTAEEPENLSNSEKNSGATVGTPGDLVSGDRVSGDKVAGDFIGRDQIVFQEIRASAGGLVTGVRQAVHIRPPEIERIGNQVERLRGRIARLIPAEELMLSLASLREKSTDLSGGTKIDAVFSPFSGMARPKVQDSGTDIETLSEDFSVRLPSSNDLTVLSRPAANYLDALSEVESYVSPETDPEKLKMVISDLSKIGDEINIGISRLNSIFVSIVHSSTSSYDLLGKRVATIGHKALKEEAGAHLDATAKLVEKLNYEELTSPKFDVLSDEAYAATGIMYELEKRRLSVEALLQADGMFLSI